MVRRASTSLLAEMIQVGKAVRRQLKDCQWHSEHDIVQAIKHTLSDELVIAKQTTGVLNSADQITPEKRETAAEVAVRSVINTQTSRRNMATKGCGRQRMVRLLRRLDDHDEFTIDLVPEPALR